MRRALTFIAISLGLSGCIPAGKPPLPPAPSPQPVPVVALPPPAAVDWSDWPLSAGTWAYRRDARGSIALFGRSGADALLTLRCDPSARRLYLSRQGDGVAPMAVRTTTATRSLAVQPTGGTPAYVAAELASTDPLLDAMAFSRGHFTAEQAGAATLVVPAWPEIGRVIEDCRS